MINWSRPARGGWIEILDGMLVKDHKYVPSREGRVD